MLEIEREKMRNIEKKIKKKEDVQTNKENEKVQTKTNKNKSTK